jgi:hypothetical protein
MSVQTFTKDPQAELPYSLNWASWLDGDTISTSEWAASGSDDALIVESDSNSTTVSTVVLSGGTVNRNYTVTNTITTAAGYTDERSITIQVRQR